MLTSYNLYLRNIGLSLDVNETLRNESGIKTSISIGSSVSFFDIHNFYDRMDANPSLFAQQCENEKFSMVAGGIGTFSNREQLAFWGYENTIRWRDSVVKAMLISILDGDSKRSSTVGVGTTAAKLDIFYNTLIEDEYKDYTIKPWNNWNDSVGVCTPTSVSRSNNVATVTTTPAHGMTTSFDDWGIIMNLNTGIATSFNISTSTYPNGIPIKIVDSNTFTYTNVGINTPTTAVVGIASIQVGWGGTSNNLHLYLT